MRLRRLLPYLFFAAVTLFVFRSVLFPNSFGDGRTDVIVSSPQSDVINEILPMQVFGFGQMRHGNLPLWNPYLFSGIPFFAGFQAALLYPPNWLHLLVATSTAINWLQALHIFWAGSTMYLWVRGRGASAAAAVLAGLIFMFSAPVFLRVYAGPLSHLNVMVWTPLLLLSIDRLSAGQVRWMLVGGGAVALQILGGSPQFVYYTALVTAVYVTTLLWTSPNRRKLIYGAMAIYGIGAMLAAVQLFAGAGALTELVRSNGTRYAFASSLPLPPEDLLTSLLPNVFGKLWQENGTEGLEYFGRSYLWESSLFIGVGATALATFAVTTRWRRSLPAVVMIAVTLALALGRHLPVYHFLYDHFPLYKSFRVTSKFVYLTVVFICPLAADGLDVLLDRTHRRAAARTARVLFSLGLILLIIVVRVGNPQSMIHSLWISSLHSILASSDNISPPQQRSNPAFEQLTVQNFQVSAAEAAAAALVAAALFALSRRWPRAGFGLIVLVLIEMVAFAQSSFATTVARRPYPPAWRAAMQSKPIDDRVLCFNLPPGADITYLDWGMVNGAQQLWGYDPGVLKRYAEMMAVSQNLPADAASQYLEIHRTPPGLLKMLRCRLGFTFADDNGVVVRYPQPLAVAQLVPTYTVVPDHAAMLARVNAPNFEPSKTVLLESKPNIEPGRGSASDRAEVIASETDWLQIHVTVAEPSLLLVTNNYSTGWHATPGIPGGPQKTYEVMPADATLMAIPLAAGHHDIRLEYKPLAYVVGRDVSLVSLPLFLIACGLTRRASRGTRSSIAGMKNT